MSRTLDITRLFQLPVLVLLIVGFLPWIANGQSTLYNCGRVYTENGQFIAPGQVLVTRGKIEQVGQSIEIAGGVTVVDLGASVTLLPGLVNAYTQAGLDEPDEVTREVTPQFAVIDTIDFRSRTMQRQLSNGITTVCICPGTENVISGIAGIVKTTGIDPALQIIESNGPLVASLCSDPGRRNQARQRPDSIYVRQPTNRMGVIWLLRNTFHKAQQTDSGQSLLPVKQVMSQDRSVMVVSRKSHDLNALLALSDEFGFTPILVGGQESRGIARTLSGRNVSVVISPLTTGSMRGPEDSELCWNIASVLASAGVLTCLSGNDLLEQMRFASRFGMDESQAIAAVTSSPARMLGIDDRVGAIVAGRDADMIALDGNPFEFTTAIKWVMVDGELIELKKEN